MSSDQLLFFLFSVMSSPFLLAAFCLPLFPREHLKTECTSGWRKHLKGHGKGKPYDTAHWRNRAVQEGRWPAGAKQRSPRKRSVEAPRVGSPERPPGRAAILGTKQRVSFRQRLGCSLMLVCPSRRSTLSKMWALGFLLVNF